MAVEPPLSARDVVDCDWLQGVPPDLVADLVAASDRRTFDTGEVLVRSGDAPEQLFVLVSGRVGAWRGADGGPPAPRARTGSGTGSAANHP